MLWELLVQPEATRQDEQVAGMSRVSEMVLAVLGGNLGWMDHSWTILRLSSTGSI